jgi:hypothetical protein
MGKIDNATEVDPIYRYLKTSMVISKINPTTSLSNELQWHINSWLKYGTEGLKDATFGKEGNTLVKELGLDNLKGKIADEMGAESFSAKWMKAMGMESSEARNYKRAASAAYGAIEKSWEALKKNPADQIAKDALRKHAMFPTDADLAKALSDGTIPDYEMKMGVMEGVRRTIFYQSPGERPVWANSGAGSTAYMFHNYIVSQMQLLADAPLSRQLAYVAVIAPITGLPIMILRKMLRGDPLPEKPEDWYIESATSGPGTPYDVGQASTTPAYLLNWLTGGFSSIVETATASNKPKAAVRNVLPFGSTIANWMFPKQQ